MDKPALIQRNAERRAQGWKTAEISLDDFDALIAENDELRSVMSAVTNEIPRGEFIQPGNAPGHCHEIPGVWDQGNGDKAGKECGWCKVWNAAVAMSKEAGHD